MYEDDPRWQSPAQPHGLTRLQRDPDVGESGDLTDPFELGAEL